MGASEVQASAEVQEAIYSLCSLLSSAEYKLQQLLLKQQQCLSSQGDCDIMLSVSSHAESSLGVMSTLHSPNLNNKVSTEPGLQRQQQLHEANDQQSQGNCPTSQQHGNHQSQQEESRDRVGLNCQHPQQATQPSHNSELVTSSNSSRAALAPVDEHQVQVHPLGMTHHFSAVMKRDARRSDARRSDARRSDVRKSDVRRSDATDVSLSPSQRERIMEQLVFLTGRESSGSSRSSSGSGKSSQDGRCDKGGDNSDTHDGQGDGGGESGSEVGQGKVAGKKSSKSKDAGKKSHHHRHEKEPPIIFELNVPVRRKLHSGAHGELQGVGHFYGPPSTLRTSSSQPPPACLLIGSDGKSNNTERKAPKAQHSRRWQQEQDSLRGGCSQSTGRREVQKGWVQRRVVGPLVCVVRLPLSVLQIGTGLLWWVASHALPHPPASKGAGQQRGGFRNQQRSSCEICNCQGVGGGGASNRSGVQGEHEDPSDAEKGARCDKGGESNGNGSGSGAVPGRCSKCCRCPSKQGNEKNTGLGTEVQNVGASTAIKGSVGKRWGFGLGGGKASERSSGPTMQEGEVGKGKAAGPAPRRRPMYVWEDETVDGSGSESESVEDEEGDGERK